MRLSLPMFESLERTVSRWMSSLNSTDFLAPSDFAPSDWEPTISSAMTLANVKVGTARYLIIGSMAWITIRVTFDVTAAAADRILFTVPFDMRMNDGVTSDSLFTCNIFENTVGFGVGAAVQQNNTNNQVAVFKKDGTNWAVSTGHIFRVSGWCEIQ